MNKNNNINYIIFSVLIIAFVGWTFSGFIKDSKTLKSEILVRKAEEEKLRIEKIKKEVQEIRNRTPKKTNTQAKIKPKKVEVKKESKPKSESRKEVKREAEKEVKKVESEPSSKLIFSTSKEINKTILQAVEIDLQKSLSRNLNTLDKIIIRKKSSFQLEVFAYYKGTIISKVKSVFPSGIISHLELNKEYELETGNYVKRKSQVVKKVLPTEKSNMTFPIQAIDTPPIFPGCESSTYSQAFSCFERKLRNHISTNFQYPDIAQEMGYEGIVEVFFVIDNDGYVKKIIPNGGNVVLQDEATRIINNLPRMIPGIDNNKKINSSYSISITFKLE